MGVTPKGKGGSSTLPCSTVRPCSSIVLKPVSQKAVDALLDTFKLFGIGLSWGGFESLIIPSDCNEYRERPRARRLVLKGH